MLCKMIFAIAVTSSMLVIGIRGQSTTELSSKPSNEIFKPDDDLISDAINSGKRIALDVSPQETIRLYNEDGSIWYEFSFNKNSPIYYEKNKKSDFEPFVEPINGFGTSLLFRIKASSENWYEVIVNESTKMCKYIPKNDPVLDRLSFEKILLNELSHSITFNAINNPLRQTPNGDIKNIEFKENDYFTVIGIEGDWLKMSLNKTKESGWIRWRKNRKILIGCAGLLWKVEE